MAQKPEHEAEIHAWRNAIHRCHNPKHRGFNDYGGRGICVCDEWRAKDGGFEAFFAHVGPRTSPKHSLDRLDNDGDYAPGNVAWRTRSEQQKNRRRPRYNKDGPIELHGQLRTVGEWVEISGVKAATLRLRYRSGRSDDEVLFNGRLPRREGKRHRNIPGLYL